MHFLTVKRFGQSRISPSKWKENILSDIKKNFTNSSFKYLSKTIISKCIVHLQILEFLTKTNICNNSKVKFMMLFSKKNKLLSVFTWSYNLKKKSPYLYLLNISEPSEASYKHTCTKWTMANGDTKMLLFVSYYAKNDCLL